MTVTPLKEEKGPQERARGRWERMFSWMSRWETDLRGGVEERNKRVPWLKNGERSWIVFITVEAFWVGLDGRESKKPWDNIRVLCWIPYGGCASDVKRSGVEEWDFEKPDCVKKKGKRSSGMWTALPPLVTCWVGLCLCRLFLRSCSLALKKQSWALPCSVGCAPCLVATESESPQTTKTSLSPS